MAQRRVKLRYDVERAENAEEREFFAAEAREAEERIEDLSERIRTELIDREVERGLAAQRVVLAGHVGEGATLRFDLADLRGYAYYSGVRFGIYTPGASDALVRGGRYDEVGAVFGRNRPAVGFSLDVKELMGVASKRSLKAAIRAPWLDAGPEVAELRGAIAHLRREGVDQREEVHATRLATASNVSNFSISARPRSGSRSRRTC